MASSQVKDLSIERKPSFFHKFLPILGWLPSYKKSWLSTDLLAGLAVWALAVPQAMAYAGIAGVPAVYGLYALPLALIAYAIFGTSHTLGLGPDSALAMLSAATVGALAAQGSEEFLALSFALALMVGLLFIIFGLLRLGWVAHFLANPVLKGFMQGLALVVLVGQLPKIFGVEGASGNFFQELWAIIVQLPQANLVTMIIGFSSLSLLFAFRHILPRAPGALIAVVLAIFAVSIFDLTAYGVDVVGVIETSLPPLGLPDVSLGDLAALVPGALALVLVGYSKSLGMAKTASETTREKIDTNQEMIALGISNASSGFSSGIAVGGSMSRTTTVIGAGGRTQLTALVNAFLVILTLLFLMPFFENLPQATLGAIVIYAMIRMLDFGYFKRLYRISRPEFWYASAAFLGELFLGTLPGVLMGVILSLLVLIRRVTRPGTAVIGRMPDETYRDVNRYPEAETVPGLLIFRFDSVLFFSNADYFTDEVQKYIDRAKVPVQQVLVNSETINDLDTTGTDRLIKLHEDLKRDNIQLAFAEVKDPVREMMRLSGAEEAIGEENFYSSVSAGVRAFLAREQGGTYSS
jgi:high affinity sulfate transporter 1